MGFYLMIVLLELERAVHNITAQFPMKPLWLATTSFIEKKLGLGPSVFVCLYCFNTLDSFFHVKIVSVLAWELRMEKGS